MEVVRCRHCSALTPKTKKTCNSCSRLLEGSILTVVDPPEDQSPPRITTSESKPRMQKPASIWARIKEAHRTTCEIVAIQMLQQNYTALVNLGMSLPPDRSAEAIAKFVALANGLKPEFSNWSEHGFLEAAKKIRNDARADQHLNRSSAIAKGLIAVWVECHACSHPFADLIKKDLDYLIEANTPSLHKTMDLQYRTAVLDLAENIHCDLSITAINYGYEPADPILCKDIISSKFYISALRYEGRRVQCDRQGSVMGPADRVLDHYSVSDINGHIADLYVDAHAGASASDRVPYGFTLFDPP